ncbi:MAG: aminopeptidase, partial [bacterium]|nr:aminopeptidase [bacterium]
CLDRYARILVEHAIGLREGQPLFIYCELIHRDFALRVGEAAYSAGAGQVRYRLLDPLETAQLIRRGRDEQIALFYVEYQAWLADLLRSRGALLLLDGKGDPQLLPELQREHPQRHLFFARESSAATLELGRRVLEQRLSPAVIAVFPTPAWARRVFPELPADEAFRRLSELVFRFTYADRADALARATAERRRLEARRAALDALGIREIRVTGGGNDLRVGFCAQSRWRDGSFCTTTGQRFLANVPSFEIYTTPDRRRTEGRLVASRPIRLQGGIVVDGLVLEFRNGRVVGFEAGRSAEGFGRWLDVDGARYLGEFALVGEDTPIARCGREFEHTLLDENAAAHIALGQGFPAAL